MVSVYFYNPVFKLNNKYVDVGSGFIRLLELIKKEHVINREKGIICLRAFKTRHEMQNDSEDIMNNKLCFTKIRDKKPHQGDRKTESIEAIDKDVYELTSVFYEYSSNLFLLEYNHFGASIKDIGLYFNSFLEHKVNTSENKWTIEFIAVENDISLDYLLNSPDIKGLELQIDVENNNFNYEGDDLLLSSFSDTIQKIVEFNKKHGERVATFKFSRGRFKKDTMSIKNYRLIISLLHSFQKDFKAIYLYYKDKETRKSTKTNLKNIKKYKIEVEIDDNASWEFTTDIISREFLSNRVKTDEYKKFRKSNDFTRVDLPIKNDRSD